VVRDVVQSVAKIPNAILREVYLRDSAQRLGIEERSLYAEMERIRGSELKNASQRRPDRDPYEDPTPPEMQVQRPQAPRPLAVEESLIRVLLQHGSDRMLELMRRHTSAKQQRDLVMKLRDRIPGMAIRTTFITGHPGETQEDHEELMAFIDECQFDAVGVFKYSPEDGTPSGTMDKDPALHVPDEIKEARENELMLLQQEIAFENAAYLAEQKVQFDVLIEGPVKGRTAGRATTGVTKGGSLFTGRTYFQAPQIDSLSYIHSREPLVAGELVRCTVIASDGYDLVMQPTEDLERSVKLPVLGR